MKIIIKKNNKNFLEEARTFQDATTNLGKYKKKLINKLRTLEKEQPEQLADEIIENMKNSIEEKYEVEGKNYTLPDGERVAVFDWLKNLTINNTNNLIGMLSKGQLDNNIKTVLAHFILSKKFTPVKSVSEFEDLIDLDTTTSDAWWQWKESEQRKREKESLKSSDQNIEELVSPSQKWEIFIPQDKQAAIYLGQICRSTWCTSARSERNMFSTYHKKDDPLFIIKHKTEREAAEVKNPQTQEIEEVLVPLMFQVHFGTQQFMDRKDKPISNEKKIPLLNLIQSSKTVDGKPIEEKYPVVETYTLYTNKAGEVIEISIDESGVKIYSVDGRWHREDGPAREHPDGKKEWWIKDRLHRENGPAVEHSDGKMEWWIDGEIHREDGPAVKLANGDKEWYLNDQEIAVTYSHDFETPPEFIKAGGKKWDWKNDPWFNKQGSKEEEWNYNDYLEEHFRRFRKLWL